MWEGRWLLLILYGFLLATAVSDALKGTRQKFKIATTSTTTTSTEDPQTEDGEGDNVEGTTIAVGEGNGTTGHTLTGNPQIDYIWDPNLPRELNGYNLSDYPFYNSIPEDINFKCDGLHDGFYASVPHKCQVYHHCLYGTRYDFLCANFTAFDQKTFICHFVSEVDCNNSKKYWHRNDALYQAATSTTTTTTTTTTTPAPTSPPTSRSANRDREPGRRRRPFRRRPAYDYYEDYYDDEYDPRGRPRGYDRRDYEDYEERTYRRDRDRNRDFRERPRDPEERERETSPRERFPARPNRKNNSRLPTVRDPLEEESRPRSRDQETSRSKDLEDPEFDDRRSLDSRSREITDKRFRDEYEDKETVAAPTGNTDGLVKPAAPSSSVYSRPRAPPKIRRPVPISEQDKYAYKVTSTQAPVVTEEPRRRPSDTVLMDEYYDDDLEEVRPRRPLRRRPPFRDFYETRDRDLDRPYRTRYRDEDEDVRQRKHPERPRDRYYDRDKVTDRERSRDRSLDSGKDRERDRSRSQDTERPILSRPLNRERETDRFKSRTKETQDSNESTQRPSIYDRTTTTTTTTTTISKPEIDQSDQRPGPGMEHKKHKSNHEEESKELPEKYWRPTQKSPTEIVNTEEETEYTAEYYDEEEVAPTPPPRAPVRIVKRPFLPSRGGNPNPRGLSPVGFKALKEDRESQSRWENKTLYNAYKVIQTDKRPDENQEQRRPEEHRRPEALFPKRQEDSDSRRPDVRRPGEQQEVLLTPRRPEELPPRRQEEIPSRRPEQRRPEEPRRPDETELSQKRLNQIPRRPEDHQRFLEEQQRRLEEQQRRIEEQQRRPEELNSRRTEEWKEQKRPVDQGPRIPEQERTTPWNYQHQTSDQSVRNNGRVIPVSENFFKDDIPDQPTGPANFRVKQRLNEVTRLQDIPESEYDVTLNEALTPSLNQETNLPSGFVLPLHRQLGRDTILQPSENNFKFSRPIQQQQQKSFVPSPSFLPQAPLARNNNDRSKTGYFSNPDAVLVSGNQYRSQRGHWHDYTGY
ncbi:zinc finger CCCH domain-containing protein 13 [Leptopilina heterotoma]|uniref:zinc finger CCCH domain-containing protein 13 n=1 Tax=Leptopilina heterotoma TaxID=63436 RepID=UPI001CA942D5|nr:zinc finger CCCH domain-containing protein 13 [Leptopilina heterotoma]